MSIARTEKEIEREREVKGGTYRLIRVVKSERFAIETTCFSGAVLCFPEGFGGDTVMYGLAVKFKELSVFGSGTS